MAGLPEARHLDPARSEGDGSPGRTRTASTTAQPPLNLTVSWLAARDGTCGAVSDDAVPVARLPASPSGDAGASAIAYGVVACSPFVADRFTVAPGSLIQNW
jgi:hypothetical protein